MASHECIELLDSSDDEEEAKETAVPSRPSGGANTVICIDSSDDERVVKKESTPARRKQDNVPKKPQQEVIEIDSSDDEWTRARNSIKKVCRTKATVPERDESDSSSDDCDSSDDECYRRMHNKNRVLRRKPMSQTMMKSEPVSEQLIENAGKPGAMPLHQRAQGKSATGQSQEQSKISSDKQDSSKRCRPTGQSHDNNVAQRNQARNIPRRTDRQLHPSPPRNRACSDRPSTPSPRNPSSIEVSVNHVANREPHSRPQNQPRIQPTNHASLPRQTSSSASLKRPMPGSSSRNTTISLMAKNEAGIGTNSISSDDSFLNSGPTFGNGPMQSHFQLSAKSTTTDASLSRPTGNIAIMKRPKSGSSSHNTVVALNGNNGGENSTSSGGSTMQSEHAPIPRKKSPSKPNAVSLSHRLPSSVVTTMKGGAIPRKRPAANGDSKDRPLSAFRSSSIGGSRQQQSKQRPMPPTTKNRNSQMTPSRTKASSLSPPKKKSPSTNKLGRLLGGTNKQNKKTTKLIFGASPRTAAKGKAPPPPDDDTLVALGRSKATKRPSFLGSTSRIRPGGMPRPSPPRGKPEPVAKRKSPPPLSSRPPTSILRNKDEVQVIALAKEGPVRPSSSRDKPEPMAKRKSFPPLSSLPRTSTSRNEEEAQVAAPPMKEAEPTIVKTSRVPPADLLIEKGVERVALRTVTEQFRPLVHEANGARDMFQRGDVPSKRSTSSSGGTIAPMPKGCSESVDAPFAKKQDLSDSQTSLETVVDRSTAVHRRESSQPLVPEANANNMAATPFPSRDAIGGEKNISSSTGSVVSPAEDFDERIDLTSGSHQGSPASRANIENAADDPLSSENTKGLAAPPSTAGLMDSPTMDSQGSSDFAESSDSDGDSDEEEMVAENTNALRDSFASDEGLNVWTRRTRKKINYSEPADDFQFTKSQMYVDVPTPPAKRRKGNETTSEQACEVESRDATSSVRSSTRKRKSVSNGGADSPTGSVESMPDLEEEQGEIDRELKGSLHSIEHLSKYTYDNDGRPTHDFSVLGLDDTIYDLRVQVKPSQIPGSGMGAYLTFRGARVLKEELQKEADEKLGERVYHEAKTTLPLEAVSPDGYGISVKLTGDNLHGNQNNPYWLPVDLEAEKNGKGVRSRIDEEDEESLNSITKDDRVGHLGIHTEDDYVLDRSVELRCVDFSIELGRYGPVLKSDRKREPDYDLKNYLFSDAPAEYGFGVAEPLAGGKQVIDLTDDATGTRHEAALRLPMSYINEVGHSKTMKANVLIRDKEDRSVFYYLLLHAPLKMGESVELLTNYDSSYEPVRERKGYGKANLENQVKSNDHEPTALRRNFEERGFIVDLIDSLGAVGLFHLTEFAVENILVPLDSLIEEFFQDGTPRLTCLQWVARYRFGWIGELILQRCSTLLKVLGENGLPSGFPHRNLLKQVKKWGNQMRWNHFDRHSMESLAARDSATFVALKVASKEDILYSLSKKIVKPLDESMWCPAASKLISDLCEDTTASLSMKTGARDKFLLQSYLGRAREAEVRIRGACRDIEEYDGPLSLLKFISNVTKGEVVTASVLKNFGGFKDKNFFLKHTTVRKGILATLLEIQSYQDSLAVASLPEPVDVKIAPNGCTSHDTVIVRGGGSSSNATGVLGYPRLIDSVRNERRIHEEWYLLWQVVYVVHCFASEFIGKPASEVSLYSLARLCAHVDLDLAKAQAVVNQGIDTTEYPIFGSDKPARAKRGGSRKQSKSQSAPRRAKATQSPRGPTFNKALFDGAIWKALVDLGWTLDVGNRPRDFYFLPPGVKRGRAFGFSNRKDYFDSAKLVLDFIQTDSRWKDRAEVVEALDLFKKLDKLRVDKKLPKNFDVEKLKADLKKT